MVCNMRQQRRSRLLMLFGMTPEKRIDLAFLLYRITLTKLVLAPTPPSNESRQGQK